VQEDQEFLEEMRASPPRLEPVPEQRPAAPYRGGGSGRITRREREVALLIGRGMTNRQIGRALGLSEHTVANHIAKILKKLGFRCRAQVAAWLAGT
jgi:DNA-binding NarL/FixJ family response regulator